MLFVLLDSIKIGKRNQFHMIAFSVLLLFLRMIKINYVKTTNHK